MRFCFKDRALDSHKGCQLMGILNVTPDSFSDGGKFNQVDLALAQAKKMLEAGAGVIDVGGESTRPGAKAVEAQEEIDRVCPVIAELRKAEPESVISIDTRKAEVAAAAVEAGADIINDVSGLSFSPEIAKVAADSGAGLILMHMRGVPESMQYSKNLEYGDVVTEVGGFLLEAANKAQAAGVPRESIMLDPGIGFAKNIQQNLSLLGKIKILQGKGYPVLVGHSRKSFMGKTLHKDSPKTLDAATIGVAVFLEQHGVEMIRVHDVQGVNDALTMYRQCVAAQ